MAALRRRGHRFDKTSQTPTRFQVTRFLLAVAATLAAATGAVAAEPAATAGQAATDVLQADLKLGAVAACELRRSEPLTAPEAQHIRNLISRLGEIDKPDLGLTPTASGHKFLPIKDREHVGTFLFTDHGLASSEALRELESLGPKAFPFLLKSLDDRTATQLVVEHRGNFGAMYFSSQFWGNPVNPREGRFKPPLIRIAGEAPGDRLTSYTVTIGDVCFVALGQIVGRDYEAVRYVPSQCVAIVSPPHDAKLADTLRDMWDSDHPHQALFDSLCVDFATEGATDWGRFYASRIQAEAAMRLVFYYPNESRGMIADYVRQVKVRPRGDIDDSGNSETLSAIEPKYLTCLVDALAWSNDAVIKEAVGDLRARLDEARRQQRQLKHPAAR